MERRVIAVRGTVQGVGFRPFVFNLASRLGLGGSVSNAGGGVAIEIEGDPARLDQFLLELTTLAPPLARIEDVSWERQPFRGDRIFCIERSLGKAELAGGGSGGVVISPDVGICAACLAELFDPENRRHRHAFLNCTNCGPRLTIITGAPYDRERTTMASFNMCDLCRAEYENPADRRFHAQPTACPTCGPRLWAADATGRVVETEDPLTCFGAAIRAGRIGAMKGLGGYHLVCDASDAGAVAELRRRKHRDEKPFAIMVQDLNEADKLCTVTELERELLISTRRPIVLLRKRSPHGLTEWAAPGNPRVGVMLPYTPLHHLLMREAGRTLVMTSGNRADEPISIGEPQVFEALAGIADLFLAHDRLIHVRCDDSVTRVIGAGEAARESPIRRSRGDAPQPVRLPMTCRRPILAVGGQLKGTFALGHERQAILSHHLGDLDHLAAYRAFERDIALYEQLFAIRPEYIAHDLHPDYASTRYAKKRAAAEGVALISVQHHHAHMASCMAEHGIDERVIGVSFDGTGFGTDGAVWGGEFLVGDFAGFERAAHLRYVRMPGGETAVKEPWRMAAAYLADAGIECAALRRRIDPRAMGVVERIARSGFNAPFTSSMGRLFDAVASLIGVRDRVNFESQAAMELEWLAADCWAADTYSFEINAPHAARGMPWEIDMRPMMRQIAAEVDKEMPRETLAAKFHCTIAEMTLRTCVRLRESTGIGMVVLSGGVFMNAVLHSLTEKKFQAHGFSPVYHRLVPANDGGLSLGQLAIAARRIGATSCA